MPDASTEAVPGAVLVHVPPPTASAKVMVAAGQTKLAPVMAAGGGFTVIVEVASVPQPVA
jgi:hypothetical protein